MYRLVDFINDSSSPISDVYEIAVHLAKLEQVKRRRVAKDEVLDVDYLLFDNAPVEVIDDLDNLMAVFEERFMVKEIINVKSEVVFNPNFGVGSALVSGADADVYIDGTLYDFKTQDNSLKRNDNLQMIGYYLLNELAVNTMSDDLGFIYTNLHIRKLSFYKARHGEIESYNVEEHLPSSSIKIKQKLKEVAEHFKLKQGGLHLCLMADIDYARELLEEIRNWDVHE
jgi:hypothetical protein